MVILLFKHKWKFFPTEYSLMQKDKNNNSKSFSQDNGGDIVGIYEYFIRGVTVIYNIISFSFCLLFLWCNIPH